MLILNSQNHCNIVVPSLNKAYNKAKINGKLIVDDIYILEAISKLLLDCYTSLQASETLNLRNYYNTILNNSKYVCNMDLTNNLTNIPSTSGTILPNIPGLDTHIYGDAYGDEFL